MANRGFGQGKSQGSVFLFLQYPAGLGQIHGEEVENLGVPKTSSEMLGFFMAPI